MPVNRSRHVGRGPEGGALSTGGRHAKIAAAATAIISNRMRRFWFGSRTSGVYRLSGRGQGLPKTDDGAHYRRSNAES